MNKIEIGSIVETKLARNEMCLEKEFKLDEVCRFVVVRIEQLSPLETYFYGFDIETLEKVTTYADDCKLCEDENISSDLREKFYAYAQDVATYRRLDCEFSHIREKYEIKLAQTEKEFTKKLDEIISLIGGDVNAPKITIRIEQEFLKENGIAHFDFSEETVKSIQKKIEKIARKIAPEKKFLSEKREYLKKLYRVSADEMDNVEIVNTKNLIGVSKDLLNRYYSFIDVYQKELIRRGLEFDRFYIPSDVCYTTLKK